MTKPTHRQRRISGNLNPVGVLGRVGRRRHRFVALLMLGSVLVIPATPAQAFVGLLHAHAGCPPAQTFVYDQGLWVWKIDGLRFPNEGGAYYFATWAIKYTYGGTDCKPVHYTCHVIVDDGWDTKPFGTVTADSQAKIVLVGEDPNNPEYNDVHGNWKILVLCRRVLMPGWTMGNERECV